MKPARFDFLQPETLDETVAILSDVEDVKILAGGQSLLPMMNMRLARPEVVVALGGVKGLDAVGEKNGTVTAGALVVQERFRRLTRERTEFRALADAIGHIGHPQTRSMGTVAGSIAHADPSAELPLLLQVHRGSVEVVGPAGRRCIPAREFFQFPFTTALAADELIVATHWPVPPPGAGSAFREFARRRGDFAMVAAACQLVCNEAQYLQEGMLGVGGAAGTPLALPLPTALKGQPYTKEAAEYWIDQFSPELDPPDDLEASSDLRRTLVRTLGREVIHEAYMCTQGGL